MKVTWSKIIPSVGIVALLMAGPAQAQDAAGAAAEENSDEIVVTGTQIRGVQATGSQTLALDAEDIRQEGAVSTSELLAAIPQIGHFNDYFEGEPRGAERGITINRPNLRSLPGFNSASGSVTLILLDGHHLTPVGVNESAIDPDIIPAAVLQRVEVVTDGGSSIYGADAVGGVINFISKRSFDGLTVDANYGIGDSVSGFQQWDATATAGASWQNGGGYISIGTSDRDGILNGQTDWARFGTWQPDGSLLDVGTQCREPVGTEMRYFWVDLAGGFWTNNPLAPGAGEFAVGSPCNQFAEQTLLPQQERDNMFASLSQDLTDNVALHVTAYYTNRTTTFAGYPLGYTTRGVVAAPPRPPAGTPQGTIQAVPIGIGFSFGPNAAYVERNQEIEIETFGISPELTVDLSHDWQVRNTFVYGQSDNTHIIPRVNEDLAQDYIDAGQLNPSNVVAADAGVIQDILDWEEARETNQEMFDFRSVADGPVLQLPAGPLRAAVGVEYVETRAEARGNVGQIGAIDQLSFDDADRNVYSVFGELAVPVATFLDLSLSARYDNYSDFGSTTNPNIGFDLHPVSWFSIFGHWGKSFNAPTVIDQFGIATAVVNANNSASVLGGIDIGGVWDGVGDDVLQGTGASGELSPQTSEQWQAGFIANPIDGLEINLTYYEIDFTDILGATNPLDPRSIATNPEKYIWNPTQAQLDAYIASLDNASELASLNADDFALILDRRTANISSAHLKGLDFGVNYIHETSVGTFNIGVDGTYNIGFTLDDADFLQYNTPDLYVRGTLGWTLENLTTALSVNYRGGFDTDTAQNGQTEVERFTTADLFVGYDLPAGLGMHDSSLRLVVDNIFDEDPSLWRQNAQNTAFSGFTLGRVFKVGLTTTF